jgi:hypothetical protein
MTPKNDETRRETKITLFVPNARLERSQYQEITLSIFCF